MRHDHDFKNFPELTNGQMAEFYFQSPHKQIVENFECEVVKVHDGDTITVKWQERDFNFPIRLAKIDAPELNEGGEKAKEWLENRLLNEDIMVIMDPNNRVEKWGRLLGDVMHGGISTGEEMLYLGLVKLFEDKDEGKVISQIEGEF